MTAPTLTDAQKAKVRYHLGFLGVAEVSTFALGTPASVETQFIVEGALSKLLPETLPIVVRNLAELDRIEEQLSENTENLAVTKVGSISLRDDEFDKLMERYNYWRNGLANCFGVYSNPFDKRGLGGGGINLPVVG